MENTRGGEFGLMRLRPNEEAVPQCEASSKAIFAQMGVTYHKIPTEGHTMDL